MKKGIWIGLIIGLFGVLYYIFNPSNIILFPKCPFLLLTGLECPGCGSQRAIHSLLHFEIVNALRYNLLLVLSLPIIGILVYSEFRRTTKPALYSKLHNPKYVLSYFIVVIVWFIVRNIIVIDLI